MSASLSWPGFEFIQIFFMNINMGWGDGCTGAAKINKNNNGIKI